MKETFTFTELFSLAVSRVSSDKSSMYLKEAQSMHKWFTDSTCLQIMLMEFSLALKLMFVCPLFVLRLPCSKMVVAGIGGCPDPK